MAWLDSEVFAAAADSTGTLRKPSSLLPFDGLRPLREPYPSQLLIIQKSLVHFRIFHRAKGKVFSHKHHWLADNTTAAALCLPLIMHARHESARNPC